MEIINAIDSIRKNYDFFLDAGLSVRDSVIKSIVLTALNDGVTRIEISNPVRDFWALNFQEDWISRHYSECDYVFDRLVPLGKKQSTFRGEILLSAFCDYYAIINEHRKIYESKDYSSKIDIDKIAGGLPGFSIVFQANESFSRVQDED